MRALWYILLVGIGVLLGWSANYLWSSAEQRDRRADLATLKSDLLQVQQQHEAGIQTQERWRTEAEQLRLRAEEVHRLRAEVSRLRAELTESSAQATRGSTPKGVFPAKGAQGEGTDLPEGWIAAEQAPGAVAATIARELGNGEVFKGIRTDATKGTRTYGLKGRLEDGRFIALSLAEDGSVLEKTTEMRIEALPDHIRAPVNQTLSDGVIGEAREIVNGGKLSYQVVAKRPDASMEIWVRGDGTILGYSTKLRVPPD